MNERIREHVVWSGFTLQDDGQAFSPFDTQDHDISAFLVKFASMIVEDCAKIAESCIDDEYYDVGNAIRELYEDDQ